ncbi:MAG: hypothetical protein H8D42_00685 [Candidatus Marinimicrobia bacterium]|nr:hypothetical protein [Candidatus Neomarinimicrobiota bacterium]MBL7067443.1 hypothetical protein [Candidatus Neomarinimicrobiota bacterium]
MDLRTVKIFGFTLFVLGLVSFISRAIIFSPLTGLSGCLAFFIMGLIVLNMKGTQQIIEFIGITLIIAGVIFAILVLLSRDIQTSIFGGYKFNLEGLFISLVELFIFLIAGFLFITISYIKNKVKQLHHFESDYRYID